MRAVKVDNASWVPHLAEHIEEFTRRAHVEGIQPGNLQTYFAQVAQGLYGAETNEFWLIMDNSEQPVAFACWQVLGLPHIAKVYCFAVYSWTKNGRAVDLLADEFVKFGDRWNAVWWSADFVGETVAKLLAKKLRKKGLVGERTNLINMSFRKVHDEE